MRFKELGIGRQFEFDHSKLTSSCSGLDHGPWVKVSARCYRKATSPFVDDYINRQEHSLEVNHIYRVGTINVEVI